MKIMIYGTAAYCCEVEKYLVGKEVVYCTEAEALISTLTGAAPDMVFIVMKNAAGMEGVIAVKKINHQMPVAWFSNDRDFAPQAYRLNTEYFSTFPICAEKVAVALKRCQKYNSFNQRK